MAYDVDILAETGLLAYYKLNGNGNDSKGTANLTTGGTVNLAGAPLASGLSGSAVFAGAGRLSTATIFGTTTEVTIECWVRLDDDAAADMAVWALGSDITNSGYSLNVNNGALRVLLHGILYYSLSYTLVEGTIYHIVFGKNNSSGRVKLWINGAQVVDENKAAHNAITEGFTIAAHDDAGGRYFKGAVSSLAIYDRILDDGEITAHYEAGQATGGSGDDIDRINTFNANLADRHSSGAHPYPIICELAPPGVGAHNRPYNSLYIHTGPNANEHYDPMAVFHLVQRYAVDKGLSPSNYHLNRKRATLMWRDGWVKKDIPAGYNFHTHGLALDFLKYGNTNSRDALYSMVPDTTGRSQSDYFNTYYWTFSQRENAFRLMGYCDIFNVKAYVHPEVNWAVECALEHLAHFTKAGTSDRYQMYIRPFMIGLIMRSLVYYWFTFRDSVDSAIQAWRALIPPAIEAMVVHIMTIAWWPEGESNNIAFSGDYWTHGMIKYVTPYGGTIPDTANFTIATIVDSDEFTLDPSASSIDGFYRHMYIVRPGTGFGWVYDYVGATRTVKWRQWVSFSPSVGATVNFSPQGGDDGAGGNAPDGGIPVCNTLVGAAAAFAYWNLKHNEADPTGAAPYRAYHNMLFNGSIQAWQTNYTQKEYNETNIWGECGLGYKEAGDADADTTFDSFTGPTYDPAVCHEAFMTGPTEGTLGVPAEFTITLGSGTVTGNITFTLINMVDYNGNNYEGTFNVPTVVLNNTTRSGTFTFTGTTTEGGRLIHAEPDQEIGWPTPIMFGALAGDPGEDVTTYSLVRNGADSGFVGVASPPLVITLGVGVLAAPVTVTYSVTGVTGTFSSSTRVLSDGTRTASVTFTPTSAGSAVISVTNNGGLTNPSPVGYTAIDQSTQPPLVPVGVPPGTEFPIVMHGDRVTFIIPWDGKP